MTFVFGDIEGSTARWERDPDGMRASLQAHDELVREAVASAGGWVFKHTGDGFAAVFAEPLSALDAACAVERGLPEVGPLDLRSRLGVHRGTVVPRDGDYFGPDVNRAARLMDTANGGQIVVSGVTVDALDGSVPDGTALRDAGSHRLKDLGEPMQIHRLVLDEHADHRPLRTLDLGRNNLPEQVTSLVGRDDDARTIADVVRSSRLTTLTGIGGVGKTRLALQVAANMLHEFHDGVWMIELATIDEGRVLGGTALGALGIEPEFGRDPVDQLLDHLATKSALLLLDNCEHLVDDAAKFADRILRGAPHVRVLATSREALAIAGEHLWRVPSLRVDGDAAALDLFEERARSVRPDFAIDDGNRSVVTSLCDRLDGIPLAIELATARLQMLDVHQIAGHLDDRFRLLTGGARTSDERQRTLLAMMDWSYGLLTEREQALLRRVAVFTGGFDLDAATAIAAGETILEFEVLDLLGRLVETSLVQFEQRPLPRYRLLETVRQYGHDRLDDTHEAPEAHRRHGEYYAIVAHRVADRFVDDAAGALELGRRELPNMRAAMTWAFDSDEIELGLTLAIDAWEYFYNTSGLHESLVWLERGIERIDAIDTPTAARALAMTITSARNMGELELAGRLADRAESSIRDLDDPVMRADLVNAIGNRSLWDDPLAADDRYRNAIGLYRSNGSDGWVPKLINRFLVLNAAYRPERAEELLDLARSTGGRSDALQPASVEAYRLLHGAEPERALACLDAARPEGSHARAVGMPHNWALVHAYRALGDVAAARSACDAGATWRVAPLDLIFGLWKDVHVSLDEGDDDRALREATAAGRAASETPDAVWHGFFGALWTRVADRCGRPDQVAIASGHWQHHRDRLGLTMLPHDRMLFDACVQRAREALGTAAFDAAAHRGATSTPTAELV